MCGANDAVCLHGDCVIKDVDGVAYEHCQCHSMYSGSQCSFRGEMLYWELPIACTSILLLLGIGVFLTGKALVWLHFEAAKHDAFAFPRQWKTLRSQSLLSCGKWSGPTRKGLPFKSGKHHVVENFLVFVVAFLELVPWIQLTALSFLPVVPWPAVSRGIAQRLRLSLLYPMWSHLEPSQFPKLMLYLSLGFVPGVLLITCILGVKRFPLFKPQPKNSPAEDLCTLMLRLYCEWLALPVMIGLLLPMECEVIGYKAAKESRMILPALNESCFTLLQGGMASAGVLMLLLFYFASAVVTIQLNCDSSLPEPTLWTHVRYTRAAHVLKAPLAMSVVSSVNANALLLCTSCILTSLILGIMNVTLKPSVHSLINGLRISGSIMALWSGVLALVATILDDPDSTIIYEVWCLGAVAIAATCLSSIFLYQTASIWCRLAPRAKGAGPVSSSKEATVPIEKVAALGFCTGISKLVPDRRSSAVERLRSRSRRGRSIEISKC